MPADFIISPIVKDVWILGGNDERSAAKHPSGQFIIIDEDVDII
jgi:hypothetical protein